MAPLPRFEKLAPEKRVRILQSATEAFAAHGYEGASLNALIEQAGISKGAFYYYFEDKADLFVTTLRHAWSQFTPNRPFDIDALNQETFWVRINELLLDCVDAASESPSLVGLGRLVYDPPADERVRAAIEEEFSQLLDLIQRVLVKGRELQLVRDDLPLDLSAQMVGSVLEAADRWLVLNWDQLVEDEVSHLSLRALDAVRRMVEPPTGDRAAAGGFP